MSKELCKIKTNNLKVGDLLTYHNSWYVTYEVVTKLDFPHVTTLTIGCSEEIPYANYVGTARELYKNDDAIVRNDRYFLLEVLFGD